MLMCRTDLNWRILCLNIGLRMDYFDIKSYELVNPALPFYGGTDKQNLIPVILKLEIPEIEISPRIGLGFPVTESTVFHARVWSFYSNT